MSSIEKRKLERVRYWQGQALRSRDFNDIHRVEEQRRWWHNRALHNAYGIHQDPQDPSIVVPPGLQVAMDGSNVKVTAGLAYDAFGRELILETDQTIALPPSTADKQEFVLFICYRKKVAGDGVMRSSEVCFTNSGPLQPGFVELDWKLKDDFVFTDGVPLAYLEIIKNKPDLQLNQLPSPRPLARPLLASGSTVPGNTPWELWTSQDEGDRRPSIFGVQTTIDTSAAGFTDDPCYFAWLQGPVYDPRTAQLLPALFTSIAEETVGSFVFRIAFPEPAQSVIALEAEAAPGPTQVTVQNFSVFAHRQNLYVNWVGSQKNASTPFVPFLLRNPGLLLDFTLLQNKLSFDVSLIRNTLARLNKL
jgi:hypothetical protein